MKRNVRAGSRRNGGARLEILTREELTDIHAATLEVLEQTGIWVEDEEALETFARCGADVDRPSRIVRIPGHLVEAAARSAPSKLVLCGRNPRNDIVLEGNRVGFTNFGEGIQVIDPYSGELRVSTLKDVADSARVVDYLDDVDVYERAVTASDMPPESAPLHQAETWMANTSKHGTMGSGNGYLTRKLVQMGAALAGGLEALRRRPLISFNTCPVSPLKLVRDSCEIIMEAARAHIPVNVLSMAMAGGSAPVTLGGTLVIHNSEVLAGITLAQLTSKGTPVIYGSSTTAMDLRYAAASVGSPECALIGGAVAQLARYYLLPSWIAGA